MAFIKDMALINDMAFTKDMAPIRYLAVILLVFLCSCSYAVKPSVAPALNIYSSYEGKIPGTFVLVIDDSLRTVTREVQPNSQLCAAYKYPVQAGESFSSSVSQTMQNLFENMVEQSDVPSSDALVQIGADGVVIAELNEMSPRISCAQGFWSGSCTADTDISLGISVKGVSGQLLGTSVGASSVAQGEPGGICESVGDVLGKSISDAMRKALERAAERISNSQRIRSAINRRDRIQSTTQFVTY